MHRSYPDEPHRGPWTLKECNDFINEWIEDGGRGGTFYIAVRRVTPWEEHKYDG